MVFAKVTIYAPLRGRTHIREYYRVLTLNRGTENS